MTQLVEIAQLSEWSGGRWSDSVGFLLGSIEAVQKIVEGVLIEAGQIEVDFPVEFLE